MFFISVPSDSCLSFKIAAAPIQWLHAFCLWLGVVGLHPLVVFGGWRLRTAMS